MMRYLIYVIDDEEVAREGIALMLQKNYQVKAFEKAESAIQAMQAEIPDLVLLDIGLPGMSGITALEKIKQRHSEIIVMMITAYEDVDTVISAMKRGAYDYLIKPLKMDSLIAKVQVALETIAMRKEIQALHEKYLKENLPCFIGESNAIQDIMEVVGKAAESPDTPILVVGETGTGKELIARAIHYRSPHFKGPLVNMNCAAIPRELIESELFGYEKGAFSGASTNGKVGLVEKAADGTLFLDEIGDLSMSAQAKLLRFLETGEFYRVGGTQKQTVKPRIVAATNRDLQSMIEADNFRRDLYYRLAVIKVEVPSLNQRKDDILPIAKHYLMEFNEKFGKSFSGISDQAAAVLRNHHWTGNVRELKNLIEREVLLSEGPVLELHDLESTGTKATDIRKSTFPDPLLPDLSTAGINLPDILRSVESHYFEKALDITNGNESRAARILNMSRDTFRYRRKNLTRSSKGS